MPKPSRTYGEWRKATRSGGNNGNCVEVGFTADGSLAGVRDTKEAGRADRGVLEVRREAWSRFLGAVRRGELGG
ncbi:hypothetical protein GCM10009854_15260 [Saccharopolyspora halophila]|uniref:DUF397 domain-containing protein n=1 Tax=Saccharopolyspora halophila TaxID=405551 RepID=A0ABN3FXI9_9PSEU